MIALAATFYGTCAVVAPVAATGALFPVLALFVLAVVCWPSQRRRRSWLR